ncbi:hypothetical protein PIB30_097787 [Stylosanthes scabra]|uniref:Uncharacterized protein n=1 Tax=Stylosanthes scabra TaxID=79078 RepID=A0ABU6WUN3_9FABA|nr:hypothetical protein [Stylosanthes scabra]
MGRPTKKTSHPCHNPSFSYAKLKTKKQRGKPGTVSKPSSTPSLVFARKRPRPASLPSFLEVQNGGAVRVSNHAKTNDDGAAESYNQERVDVAPSVLVSAFQNDGASGNSSEVRAVATSLVQVDEPEPIAST